jgi:hypothetical protein
MGVMQGMRSELLWTASRFRELSTRHHQDGSARVTVTAPDHPNSQLRPTRFPPLVHRIDTLTPLQVLGGAVMIAALCVFQLRR